MKIFKNIKIHFLISLICIIVNPFFIQANDEGLGVQKIGE